MVGALASVLPAQLHLTRWEADGDVNGPRWRHPWRLFRVRLVALYRIVGYGQWLGLSKGYGFLHDDGSGCHCGAYLENIHWTEGRGSLGMYVGVDLGPWLGPHFGGGLGYAWNDSQHVFSKFFKACVQHVWTIALITLM